METVAVYLESPVRTYGIKAQAGLVLMGLVCPAEGLAALAGRLGQEQPPLAMAACAASSGREGPLLSVCLPSEQAARLAAAVDSGGGEVAYRREAALISLQGPHFGDRWGIAQQALIALAEAGVEPRLVLGITHTLQLVVDPAEAEAALRGLRAYFSAPEGCHA